MQRLGETVLLENPTVSGQWILTRYRLKSYLEMAVKWQSYLQQCLLMPKTRGTVFGETS